jgi:hypothetical protein
MARAGDRVRIVQQNGQLGLVLVVAFVGALVYFVSRAHGFGGVVLAILEAMVWPAILLFHLLGSLGA